MITYVHPVRRLRMSGAIPPPSICSHGVERDRAYFTVIFFQSRVLITNSGEAGGLK
jgi:hypothetical protein